MSLEENERRKAVLRYAAGVPEWALGLKHQAAAELAGCASRLMAVSRMMLETDARDRLYPNRTEYGMPPDGYAETILHTEYSIGKAAAALEVITALADAGDVFSVFDKAQSAGLADSMRNVQAAYTVRSAELEDLCRRHGMDEVAYQHG